MTLSEELKQLTDNAKKDVKRLYEKVKQYPLVSLLFISVVFLLIAVPHWQVSEINNVTEKVAQENQSRATLAQVLGGTAIGITLYYTWRRISIAEEELKATQENLKVAQDNLKVTQEIAENNLKVFKEGQITERFTRAVEQLGACDKEGNPAIEIRLGGIYALERIANESDKDYWPIMEILTAYVRKNSGTELTENKKNTHVSMDIQAEESSIVVTQKAKKLPLDVQAILTVIGRRKYYFGAGESKRLNLSETCLQGARLIEYHLERTNFDEANLKNAVLVKTRLKQATFFEACLENARLSEAYIENAVFINAHLENASFDKADLGDVIFIKVRMECTVFRGANLENAYFEEVSLVGVNLAFANLKGTQGLTIDQLSKAKTLYMAQLDPELEKELRAKGFGHLLDDEPDE